MISSVSRVKPLSYGGWWSQHYKVGRILCTSQQPKQQISLKHQDASTRNVSSKWKYYERREKDQTGTRFNKYGLNLLGSVVGTALVISIGTALCEGQEEHKRGTLSGLTSPEVSRKGDKQTLSQDVVGTKTQNNIIKRDLEGQNNPSVSWNADREKRLEEAIKKSRKLLKCRMKEAGAPGLVVAVSVNGQTMWEDGLGFADIENNVRCTPNTVMRIASISKSITMAAVAKLWEEGKLDLDAPVQKYIPSFPVKKYEGEEVMITTRQLLSHQSGIRAYKLKDANKLDKKYKNSAHNQGTASVMSETKEENEKISKKVALKNKSKPDRDGGEGKQPVNSQDIVEKKKEELEAILKSKANKKRQNKKKEEEEDEFNMQEYYIKEKFDSIEDSLKLFQDDELFFKPGTGFLYTTHGWTVVSGVVEGAASKPFTQVITKMFHDLGLDNTYLDKNTPIIYNRARYYIRDKHGKLQNAPYVDNSYKWAGGGFLSTVRDLNKFGNAMLYSRQHLSEEGLPGYLKPNTMKELWTPVHGTNMGWDRDGGYGLGWGAVENKTKCAFCRESRHYASHTGGAIGASSVLLILPEKNNDDGDILPPKGVVVSLITNMQSVGLNKVAIEIAKIFENI